ncbi:MAG: bifunctional biotin--[acetyl-CoA-carboxylase] ligase/biotin operon repressor BirA [Spongiibacteraceae bacterium]
MSFDLRLIEILADGEFHSGEELGEMLAISRAAIWKQLQKIEEALSLKFESVKGRGYRLVGGLELLSPNRIAQSIPGSLPCSLRIVQQVDSTNRLAAELAAENAARGCVVLAEQQLAGRGRRGRKWVSPFARNLYCSLVWEFDSGIAALEGLSLAVGVAVARALRAVGIGDAALKWPNDVLHNERKLAGILLEMTGDISGRCQVVIGIGINVDMSKTVVADAIDQPWTDAITAAGKAVSRNELASILISEVLGLLVEFESVGFSRFMDEWKRLDYTFGKSVGVHVGDQVVIGTAAGVDAAGALGVDTEFGRQWFHGGEVSLRVQR